ncbi:protein ROOT HAIR DEFECTIVE 3 [Physcomitrium patens]|uniref:Protein ROOT HAIR DEFECTIVE 3 homolog n=1 Tax=Physcomitrium patens TaxID=3218 RepID=A9RWY5_PHYPA|nr:protein ROOT HAIR DEFECTIVE 3-like [Physcomitrium patens]PNR35456.1 hypothetical protein PHYPA_023356 [Physcomitrium patens]|eukprot:XP_024402965.1 protein ROOT HAIR DEFECTIVE 3-like [Physcomitrella patens]
MEPTEAPAIQLIDEKGSFNEAALVRFCKEVGLSECGLSYAVVAIMGPQSSGKSTLLNHLFRTTFKEMDALTGRNQTTKGVWLQRAERIDPCTLVMDLEGTDGRERGEDDTSFEKQSALFSLAIADIVLINLWCHDIGREQASNKPLLKTVFQVMMRLFSPRKTTLMFVVRDKTRTPMEILEPILREDVRKIWDGVPKPDKHKDTPLTEFFNVDVTALSNYEEKEEQFNEEIVQLRKRFQNSVEPGGVAGDRRAVVPGSGFPFSAHEIWKVIKENRDLDLPAHKVMVATVRCEEIAHEKLQSLMKDAKWKKLEEASKSGVVPTFGKKVSSMLEKYVSEYDLEAGFFDEGVRGAKRNYFISEALAIIQPAYDAVIANHRTNALEKFKTDLQAAAESSNEEFAATVRRFSETTLSEFDQACADASVSQSAWNPFQAREELKSNIDANAQSLRTERLQLLKSNYEKRLEDVIGEPVSAILDAASSDAWPSIRMIVENETELVTTSLKKELSGFEPTQDEEKQIFTDLSKHPRLIVEKKVREVNSQILIRMKDRFNTIFGHDDDSIPRVWGEEHDVRAITKSARQGALKMLSVIAAIRLNPDSDQDGVEDVLMTLITDSDFSSHDGSRDGSVGSNPFASSTWPGVDPKDTMLTPAQCRSLWRQLRAETEYTISQALTAQEAKRRGNTWMPPPWTIVAMFVLGFNEIMAVLRNPLYLPIVFVAFLLAKALWVQLDLQRHFQYGVLPGIVSVSARFMPSVMEAFNGLVAAGTARPAKPTTNPNRRMQAKPVYES